MVRLERQNTAERLLQASANPSTPTLVVVGSGKSQVERAWSGNTAGNGSAVGERAESGEIKVGMRITSPVEFGNRKSEMVIVESIGNRRVGK